MSGESGSDPTEETEPSERLASEVSEVSEVSEPSSGTSPPRSSSPSPRDRVSSSSRAPKSAATSASQASAASPPASPAGGGHAHASAASAASRAASEATAAPATADARLRAMAAAAAGVTEAVAAAAATSAAASGPSRSRASFAVAASTTTASRAARRQDPSDREADSRSDSRSESRCRIKSAAATVASPEASPRRADSEARRSASSHKPGAARTTVASVRARAEVEVAFLLASTSTDGAFSKQASSRGRLRLAAVAEALSPSETGLSSSVATRHDAPCFSTRLDRSAAPASVGPVVVIARAVATAIGRANARSTQRTAVSAERFPETFLSDKVVFSFLSFASRLSAASQSAAWKAATRRAPGASTRPPGLEPETIRSQSAAVRSIVARRHVSASAGLRETPTRHSHSDAVTSGASSARDELPSLSVFSVRLVSVGLVTRNASGIHRFRNASRKSSARNASAFAARSLSRSLSPSSATTIAPYSVASRNARSSAAASAEREGTLQSA